MLQADLGISYKDHITNHEVLKRIRNAVGPHEELLRTVKRRKLKWFGHVTRSKGLAKTILQGTVPGKRGRGRPRRSWGDNINEWTGLGGYLLQERANHREKWRKLAYVASAVPQRPPKAKG